MRYTLIAILFMLVCGSGCITRTTKNESGGTVGKSRTIWIWQKDFWKSQ